MIEVQRHSADGLLLAEAAASSGSTRERGQALLEVLYGLVPSDAAWLALADPVQPPRYHSLASHGLDDEVVDFLAGPQMARDIELTGTDRSCPPLSPSDLPYPAEALSTWADCLMPSGIHEALAVPLFSADGRHVGFLALLWGSRRPPPPAARRRLERLAPVLARGVDPMRSLLSAADLVRGATAGVLLCPGGGCAELPGLPGDRLLAAGSPVVAVARSCAAEGQVCSTFLWPMGGSHAPDGHVRVTVLAVTDDVTGSMSSVVLLSPAGDLHGLTPRELEVLGLLVGGCSNQEIAAALVVAPRTVATHLEHVLAKLDAPTRALAAVRAARQGLYVPLVRRA